MNNSIFVSKNFSKLFGNLKKHFQVCLLVLVLVLVLVLLVLVVVVVAVVVVVVVVVVVLLLLLLLLLLRVPIMGKTTQRQTSLRSKGEARQIKYPTTTLTITSNLMKENLWRKKNGCSVITKKELRNKSA